MASETNDPSIDVASVVDARIASRMSLAGAPADRGRQSHAESYAARANRPLSHSDGRTPPQSSRDSTTSMPAAQARKAPTPHDAVEKRLTVTRWLNGMTSRTAILACPVAAIFDVYSATWRRRIDLRDSPGGSGRDNRRDWDMTTTASDGELRGLT